MPALTSLFYVSVLPEYHEKDGSSLETRSSKIQATLSIALLADHLGREGFEIVTKPPGLSFNLKNAFIVYHFCSSLMQCALFIGFVDISVVLEKTK